MAAEENIKVGNATTGREEEGTARQRMRGQVRQVKALEQYLNVHVIILSP